MIYCLSCKRYPEDPKVIPYGSNFPIDTFRVKLLTDTVPSSLDLTGADVENLPNNVKFSVGSLLYVTQGDDGSEVYVNIDGSFELWDSPIPIEY